MLRPELTPLPDRIKSLPLDERGYPIPWFVDWVDGKPEFRAMDRTKWRQAVKERRCWVCGNHLGVYKVFVAGPMCGINRTSVEPPNHHDCAQWSAINCPFLNNPRQVRREDERIANADFIERAPGIAITRNPGVAMLWYTRHYEIWRPPNSTGLLITMGEPERVEWYCEGRTATRAEVDASIESGLPSLETAARTEKGAMDALARATKAFEKWKPAL